MHVPVAVVVVVVVRDSNESARRAARRERAQLCKQLERAPARIVTIRARSQNRRPQTFFSSLAGQVVQDAAGGQT